MTRLPLITFSALNAHMVITFTYAAFLGNNYLFAWGDGKIPV